MQSFVIESQYIEKFCLKQIRKIGKVASNVKTSLLKEYYALNIRNTLERMSDKIRKNLEIPGCVRDKINNKGQKIWIKAIKTTPITINQFASCLKTACWSKKKKLYCSICKEPISILHVLQHSEHPKIIKNFIEIVNKEGIYVAIETLRLSVDSTKTILSKLIDLIRLKENLACNIEQ